MIFSLEFTAKNPQIANKLIAQSTVPDSIKTFLYQAVTAYKNAVYVKAFGQLNENNNKPSNATLVVEDIEFSEP